MADDVIITEGVGTTIAADEVAGKKHQRVKVSLGADGEAADLDSGQQAMAASVPVVIASDQTAVPVSGTITGITNAVAVTNAALGVTGGGAEATALRVTLATDSTGVVSVDDNGGALTVDGTVAVSSIAAGDNNIGNVDIVTLPSGNLGQQAMAASLSVVPANNITDTTYIGDIKFGEELPAGTQVIGLIGAPDTVITVTPTCDTNAYGSGDLIFDSTEVAAAVRANGGHAILQSVTMIDKGDQGAAMTLLIANAATDFGTLNSAPDPDDTETATVIGWVPIATTDYIDLGGARVACVRNIGLLCKAGGSTTSLYVAAVNGTGTPTYGASDLVVSLGFLRS